MTDIAAEAQHLKGSVAKEQMEVKKMPNELEKWVNMDDIAEHFSVSKDTIRAWIKKGTIPYIRAGKQYKFKISEVEQWAREGKITEGYYGNNAEG